MLSSSPLFGSGSEKYPVRTATVLILLFVLNVLLGILIPILSESNSLYSVELLYDYQPGQLANEDVIAPYDFSFVDEIATEKARDEAAASVLPRFDFSMADTSLMYSRLEEVTSALSSGDSQALAQVFSPSSGADAGALQTKWSLLSPEEKNVLTLLLGDAVKDFVYHGVFSASELADIRSQGYDMVYATLPGDNSFNLVQSLGYTDNLLTDEGIQQGLLSFLQSYDISLTANCFTVLSSLVDWIIQPNVHYDALETGALRDQERAATPW